MSSVDSQSSPLRGDSSRRWERGTSVNRVLLTGRCVDNPDIRYTPSGNPVATFRMLIDAPVHSPSGAQRLPAAHVAIVCWNDLADSAGKHISTGCVIDLEGVLQARFVKNRTGERRQVLEVHVNRFDILDSGSSDQMDTVCKLRRT